MDYTEQTSAIVGPQEFRMIGDELVISPLGLFRLADAVATGFIEGDVQAAVRLREQARATLQARKQLN